MKKKTNPKYIMIATLLVIAAIILAGCTEAGKVSSNISKEADLFNVTRRLAVMNMRTDKPIFELVGNFSLGNNSHNELTITVQTGPSQYKKHFVYLNDWTMYVIEDISGASVSPYKYEINFMPESIVPFSFTNNY